MIIKIRKDDCLVDLDIHIMGFSLELILLFIFTFDKKK